jgi:long-chain acyl-CoA synthetase
VIVGGFNVAPSEVEVTLVSHPSVVDAAVVGLPTGSGGESVAAAVVLAPGATLDVSGLRTHMRSRLAAYKVPQRIVAVDDLPRSLIGKVLRREVRTALLARPGD